MIPIDLHSDVVVYSLLGGVVVLLGALVWLGIDRVKLRKAQAQVVDERGELKVEVEDLREGRGKLDRELAAAKDDLRDARSELERLRASHEELGRAQEALQTEYRRSARRVAELEEAQQAAAIREETFAREKRLLEARIKATTEDGRNLAEARAELLGRSRAIQSQMAKLGRDLKGWVRAIDELSGVAEGEVDERALRFRMLVRSACDELLEHEPLEQPRSGRRAA